MGDTKVWILGAYKDPHVSRVSSILEELGTDVIIVDYDQPSDMTCYYGDDGSFELRYQGSVLSENDTVWMRNKLFEGSPYYFTQNDQDKNSIETLRQNKVREQQWNSMFRSIFCSHKGRIINRGGADWPKPYQQLIAAQIGFLCPPSIVSCSKSKIQDFANLHGELITKGIVTLNYPVDETVNSTMMTTKVTLKDISGLKGDAFSSCPNFLQKRILKKSELRVVATRSDIKCFSIDSQINEYTKVDWRYGQRFLNFQPCDFPESASQKIYSFLRTVKCDYGSFDFIIDQTNHLWFLECNPDGQWGWLEKEDDLFVSRMIAKSIYE